MKRLHEKVNIIPLIAKADTLTPEECQQFKKQVLSFLKVSLIYTLVLNRSGQYDQDIIVMREELDFLIFNMYKNEFPLLLFMIKFKQSAAYNPT